MAARGRQREDYVDDDDDYDVFSIASEEFGSDISSLTTAGDSVSMQSGRSTASYRARALSESDGVSIETATTIFTGNEEPDAFRDKQRIQRELGKDTGGRKKKRKKSLDALLQYNPAYARYVSDKRARGLQSMANKSLLELLWEDVKRMYCYCFPPRRREAIANALARLGEKMEGPARAADPMCRLLVDSRWHVALFLCIVNLITLVLFTWEMRIGDEVTEFPGEIVEESTHESDRHASIQYLLFMMTTALGLDFLIIVCKYVHDTREKNRLLKVIEEAQVFDGIDIEALLQGATVTSSN